MTDYEKLYKEGLGVCGDPSPEFVRFFEGFHGKQMTVLDLGCGQGRDTLMIARMGHEVVGVDSSPTGIAQIMEAVNSEGLMIEGIVADIRTYKPDRTFDVVVLDRVLHMLPSHNERLVVLQVAADCTTPSGHILVADIPSNKNEIYAFFETELSWATIMNRKGFIFVRHVPENIAQPAH